MQLPNERPKSERAPSGFELVAGSVGGARRLGPHVSWTETRTDSRIKDLLKRYIPEESNQVLTDAEIESAKQRTAYSSDSPHHEHNDCIRIAYEWLDAQAKTQSITKKAFALKHLIERWAGRYVSTSDLEVAAELHPDIKGAYPYYNISARLTEPSIARLKSIGEAFSQGQRSDHKPTDYKIQEP